MWRFVTTIKPDVVPQKGQRPNRVSFATVSRSFFRPSPYKIPDNLAPLPKGRQQWRENADFHPIAR
jgi:hypothetical protein